MPELELKVSAPSTALQPRNVYPVRVGTTDDNVTVEPDVHV